MIKSIDSAPGCPLATAMAVAQAPSDCATKAARKDGKALAGAALC